ncbi:hypothetical protein Godav_009433, partial [Gossypium davidsonii]|nr:hypothetical protein [Gossypium davidsonii]
MLETIRIEAGRLRTMGQTHIMIEILFFMNKFAAFQNFMFVERSQVDDYWSVTIILWSANSCSIFTGYSILPTKLEQRKILLVSEVGFLLGRAGTAGLGKAVEVLDTLGSSMTNLNLSSGFTSGVTTKGNKIAILAFEVANTIVKGANLMQSLSNENIRHLKEVVLQSEGVKNLISRYMDELLRIAAADKRVKVFSGEVVRFGNRCKDPQWHNLDRYFEKLGSELTPEKQLKDEAEAIMQQLMSYVQYTAVSISSYHYSEKAALRSC